jgi:predicted HTH transcriptional regulator
MYDFHKPGFFRGILKQLGTELPRKESEKGFISAGFYAKLIVGDEKHISFVGNLNKNQKRILDVVNELKEVTARQVVEKLGLSEENVVDTLRFLVKKFFVVGLDAEADTTPHYYSFYKYF